MADLPVICDDCGKLFRTNIIGGAATVEIRNVGISPCPYCGGSGHIPDGVYDLLDHALLAVWAIHPTQADLRQLARLGSQAHEQGLSADQTASRIEQLGERFKPVSNFLRKHAAQLALLIGLLELLQSPDITVNVQQLPSVEVVIKHLKPHRYEQAHARDVPRRNELCPCGSGKKYKHCHGAPEKLGQ